MLQDNHESLSLSLKILATMSKRATISKFSQCWKASRVERHSSLSHKWCFDGASTECTAAVITGIARLTTNLPSFTVKSDQLTRYISCPLAANEAEWGEIGEKRSRQRSNVRTFIPACFPLPFPAEGANVNTGSLDFEWLLHVTALCEFPSCRATTSFASRLVIKITEGEGIYACKPDRHSRRINHEAERRGFARLVSYFASKLEGVALQFIPPPTFLSFLRGVLLFFSLLSASRATLPLVIRLHAPWDRVRCVVDF